MVFELIYTSAPKTLDGPGYGTVAKSEGLPKALERFFQNFNRYDQDLSAGGGKGLPAVFSHAVFCDGPEVWQVMSRVGFGGIDYTSRSVFLAHHLAVTRDEMRSSTAADLMRHPGLFQTVWNGQAGPMARRSLPRPPAAGDHPKVWERLAGHGDWAKVWVDRWNRQTDEPRFIIAPAEADILGLFAEALALMPLNQSRRVSFITPMIADREGVQFDWIGLTAGSKLARNASERFADRTFDLTKALGPPPRPTLTAATASTSSRTVSKPKTPRADADDRDFQEYRFEDQPSRKPAFRTRSDSVEPTVIQPPPVPPRWLDNPLAPLAYIAVGAASMLLLVLTAWQFGAFGTGRDKKAGNLATTAANQSVPTGRNETPSPPVATAPTPNTGEPPPTGIPAPIPPASSNPSAFPKFVDNVPAKASVTRLNQWLGQSLKGKPGDWIEIAKLADEQFVAFSSLKLLTHAKLELEAQPLVQEKGDGGIEVRSTRPNDKNSLAFRWVGQVLQIRSAETPKDDFLDRLALSVLDLPTIASALPSRRIFLTPRLPAIPLQDAPTDATFGSWANSFFKKTFELQNDLKPKIRAQRLSLSFLPPENQGWVLVDPKNTPMESAIGANVKELLKVNMPEGVWQVLFNLSTANFNGDDRENSPIRCWLTDLDAKPAELPKMPASNETQGTEPRDQQGGNPDSQTTKGPGKKFGVASKDRSQDKPSDELTQSNSKSKTASKLLLKEFDNRSFLLENFRRFGRLHGSIVIHLENGASGEDVEILNFDEPPVTPKP